MDGKYGHENDRGMGSFGAALIGMAVGAAAVAWAHKDTREKIKKKARELNDKGTETVEDLKDKIDEKKEKIKKNTQTYSLQ